MSLLHDNIEYELIWRAFDKPSAYYWNSIFLIRSGYKSFYVPEMYEYILGFMDLPSFLYPPKEFVLLLHLSDIFYHTG